MDDYLAQTDRALRSLTSLEQSKASSATLSYAQSESARAAAAEIRARQAERQAEAARQQAEYANRLQSEAVRQTEHKLRESLAAAESDFYRAMNRIRALETQLAQVADDAEAKIKSLKRSRKGVFQALAKGDMDALAKESPAFAAAWEQQTEASKEELRSHNVRTRGYVEVMNGVKHLIDLDVLNAMGVDIGRFETLRMHEVYEVLHRRHPKHTLENSVQGFVLAFQYHEDWDALYEAGWTEEGDLPPREVPTYAKTLEPLPPLTGDA